MYQSRLEYLIEHFIMHQCNDAEIAELMDILEMKENESMVKLVMDKYMELIGDEAQLPQDTASTMLNKIFNESKRDNNIPREKKISYRRWMSIAAAVILIVGGTIFILPKPGHKENQVNVADKTKSVIKPGGNKALLTLADGSVVDLDGMPDGTLQQQGVNIIKKDDGVLQYDAGRNGTKPAGINAFNILSTPRGGQYQLTLPDGSKVWLNAESSLKFPVVFNKDDRDVELSGEAYFEVRQLWLKDKSGKRPFKVFVNLSNGRQAKVNVLGTHFNVNAYHNEKEMRATLVEGAVRVDNGTNNISLIPGQQAKLSPDGAIRIDQHADIEGVIAWKNGLFYFDNVDIQTIMRQIGRWYDVDITYTHEVSPRHFVGKIRRGAELSEVLEILRLSDIDFKIEGKTITVL